MGILLQLFQTTIVEKTKKLSAAFRSRTFQEFVDDDELWDTQGDSAQRAEEVASFMETADGADQNKMVNITMNLFDIEDLYTNGFMSDSDYERYNNDPTLFNPDDWDSQLYYILINGLSLC